MIEVESVSKTFAGTRALDGCSLTIPDGSFFTLIGPSGCGKSTLLRTINGLIRPDEGTVRVRGKDVSGEPPERLRQGIGYVIQSVGLFPHWTIAANITAVPRLLGWDKARVARRLEEIVGLLRVDRALLPRYPHQLSGGQRQRVGVARALAAGPDLLLMDEPFSALDPVSRAELGAEMRRVHAESGTTIVMVTHDVGEALSLATGLAVMRGGTIVQAGTPSAVLTAPADAFVAQFLGGAERFLHLLDVLRVGDIAAAVPPPQGAPRIEATASLRAALSLMMETGVAALAVGAGEATLRLDAIPTAMRHG